MAESINPRRSPDPRTIRVSPSKPDLRPPPANLSVEATTAALPESEKPQTENSAKNNQPLADPKVDVLPTQLARRNPLHQHSLRGKGAWLEARAIDTTPLLGEFIMNGQATMVYAQANSGKTLTTLRLVKEEIEDDRIDADNVLYINADDSGKGLAEKVKVLEEIGAHMLAPNLKGFKANQFVDKLKQAVEEDTARGTVVIIDTLKKFTNLMDKQRSSEFAQVCRDYVSAGGTVIALGHTAKSPNSDGTPRYQGTTDIMEDFDAVYVAEPLNLRSGERVIKFTQLKSRADSPEVAAYAYSTEPGVSYRDKLASLRPIYPEELQDQTLDVGKVADEQVIEEIKYYLLAGHGSVGQDKIVRVIASSSDFSRSTVRRVLDQYTGTDPTKHRWRVEKGDRGKRIYHPLRPD